MLQKLLVPMQAPWVEHLLAHCNGSDVGSVLVEGSIAALAGSGVLVVDQEMILQLAELLQQCHLHGRTTLYLQVELDLLEAVPSENGRPLAKTGH